MKKIIFILSFVLLANITYGQNLSYNATMFGYKTSVAATSLWTVQPSGGVGGWVNIDTTMFYRTGYIDLSGADSIHIITISQDTICMYIYAYTGDGATFADSCTTVVDSVKFNGAGMNITTWKKINNALYGNQTAGEVKEIPYKIRFTNVFYTSAASGSPHSSYITRYKKFKQLIKVYR